MTLLEAENLCKDFRRGRQALPAVRGVNLSVRTGDFITITGRSGSGKTTLLTLLSGLQKPTGGAVFFKGIDIHALNDKELSALRNKDFGFVPQGAGLLGCHTVLDNVRMPQVFANGRNDNSERAAYLLDEMGLGDLKDEYPANLSGGEMRRAAIARGLFTDPALLVADEPTSDLDPENSLEVMRLLQRHNELGTTILVVTHEEETAAFGRRRFVMDKGILTETTEGGEREGELCEER